MSDRHYTRLSPAEAETLLATGLASVFDVREKPFFAQDHLPGARHLDDAGMDAALLGTPRRQPVLIYCHHGNASRAVAQAFADFGFTQVSDLAGGWEAWRAHRAAGIQAVRGVAPREPLPAVLADWLQAEGYPADDLDARLANGTTPLMRAARLGRADRVADLVIAGAPLESRNADGNTALWLACFSDDADTLDILLNAGASPDNLNDNGATCLMYAASAGKAGVVQALLAAGADASLRSLDDFTALDMASTEACLNLLRPGRGRRAPGTA
ncbi:rhodanese-like domain-containing protein [Plasticicumulans sp.]|uniref:rhodanese-like domain-containing protein n=1 Tax=Plasticicumulans sp. TaxID=2307179 RepID=UPI003938F47D